MDYYIDAYDNLGIDHRGAALHDPLAVAVAIDPSYVMTVSLRLTIKKRKIMAERLAIGSG